MRQPATTEATSRHLTPEEPVGRAVVLPGSGYTVDHPLLWWTCQVLAESGWRVVTVRWVVDEVARADASDFVAHAAERALEVAGDAEQTLIVGKSFGSFALPWAAGHGWPGVWLTPVLTEPEIADALALGSAKGLLVGGTADALWDAAVARRSGLEVFEVEDGDHILYTDQDWRRSFGGLGANARGSGALRSESALRGSARPTRLRSPTAARPPQT